MNSLKTYLVLLKRCLICQKSIAVILANNDNLTFCLQTRLIIPDDLVKTLYGENEQNCAIEFLIVSTFTFSFTEDRYSTYRVLMID